MSETLLFSEALNPYQLKAVHQLQGPLLILAGAGSGKTKALTYRIANLIAQGEATPKQILAVTFTNKAAREMENRTVQLLSDIQIPIYEPMWITTFHSSCARILRDKIHLLGYQPSFVIYDDADQLSQIKKILNTLHINETTYPAKKFKAKINKAKTLDLTPHEVAKRSPPIMDKRSLEVYKIYEEEMQSSNALDFGDLLVKTYELFKYHPTVLEEYQEKFKYIMVDEYQDTNRLQYLIVKALARKHKNICVVGDEDQSIYSWRGADIRNILDFEKDFSECTTIKLEQNYRSTQTIVDAATHLIRKNSQRKGKTLFTTNEPGEKIAIREEKNDSEEARFVAQSIKSLCATESFSYNDFSIFYRTNAQSRVLEDQLRSYGLPYRIVGGLNFYGRKEIKDILAYMKILINPNDDISVKRIINSPTRGIGKATVDAIEQVAHNQSLTFFEAINHAAEQKVVHSGATKKIRQFRLLLDEMTEAAKDISLSEIYHMVLENTQYVQRLKEEKTPESKARVDNLEELNNAILQFEEERGEESSLKNFLEEMTLVSGLDRMDKNDNAVTMMTLHISKGLEYPVVFIVGLEEGLFPTGMSYNNDDPAAMEEERRLAYVGMTRARQKLFLVYAKNRRVWGREQQYNPSRFLKEIPQQYYEFSSGHGQSDFIDRYKKKYDASASRNTTKPSAENFDAIPKYENFSDDSESANNSIHEFIKGMRVRHPTFGVGSVYQIEGTGPSQKVSVLFTDNTLKKFVTKYARLEQV